MATGTNAQATNPPSPPYLIEIVGPSASGLKVNYLTEPPVNNEETPEEEPQEEDVSVPSGSTAETSLTSGTGTSPESGTSGSTGAGAPKEDPAASTKIPAFLNKSEAEVRSTYPTGTVYPEAAGTGGTGSIDTTTGDDTGSSTQLDGSGEVPLDPRLIYLVSELDNSVIYSFTSKDSVMAPLSDGFVVKNPKDPNSVISANDSRYTADDAKSLTEFYGVPSIMNYNAYINIQAAGGKNGNKFLIDRENQPKFYEFSGGGIQNAETPGTNDITVTALVNWAQQDRNQKFPYKYQDFVYLKWWKKIPLNYMITLRRYPAPTIDSVGSAEEAKGQVAKDKLLPVATAITFLGEETGNKISTILGPIEAGLRWKDIKADVHEVSFNGSKASADSPAPGLAKVLGLINNGPGGANPKVDNGTPLDPYNNGPYANKVLGPVTVIDQVQARDRGVNFKHELNLIFEYSARSIGGINTKAAMLDIIGNLMILTYNEAQFWGGMNRYMPMGQGGDLDPFLGGPAGRSAWLNGDPEGFFKAVGDQFTKAFDTLGDVFNKFFEDPIGGLKDLAGKGMQTYMKLNTTAAKGQMQGIHSLLTGAPVGEWHVTVGNPMNPMMMIGNLVCHGIKIEFNDELGPDDFPTELKATIQLEHGMARDRSGIESMFNRGQGRLYSLPKGYEESLSSVNMTAVDKTTGKDYGANPSEVETTKKSTPGASNKNSRPVSNASRRSPSSGDPGIIDGIFGYYKQSFVPRVKSTASAIYSHGVKFVQKNT